jgi:hypothetical protein
LLFVCSFTTIRTGIGATWAFLGVTGPVAENCPYIGEMATAEYKTLSGCDVVPIEQSGDAGSRCKHWAESCLNTELMTTTLDTGANPMSRVTIGSLADLGYAVNYTNAQPFTADDLDPSCLCNNRKQRQLSHHDSNGNRKWKSIFEGEHGDVIALDYLSTTQQPTKQRRRQLSEVLRQYAITYGQEILQESYDQNSWSSAIYDLRDKVEPKSNNRKKGVRYAGQHYMSVIMRQGNDFFGVLVVRDET